MRIFFVRHGKAEAKGKVEDAKRALTREGAAALQSAFVPLAHFVAGAPVEIWSSPKLRALQTAQILGEALGTLAGEQPTIEQQAFIATGDTGALRRALAAWADKEGTDVEGDPALQKQQRCLFLTGHEPFLSQWVGTLTGRVVEFAKGAVAELRYDPSAPAAGELVWYRQPEDLFTLLFTEKESGPSEGKLGTDRSLGDALEEELPAEFRKLTAALDLFLQQPEDVEAVHQLRVSTRRFRSLLSLLKPALKKQDYKEVQGFFRLFGDRVAPLRELDVMLEAWKGICKEKELSFAASPLRETLAKRREREMRLLLRFMSAGDTRDTLYQRYGHLQGAVSGGKFPRESAPLYIARRLTGWWQDMDEQMKAAEEVRFETVHPIRLSAKKHRYVGEVFAESLPPMYRFRTKAAKQLQSSLGDLCDAIRNQEAVKEWTAGDNTPHIDGEKELYIAAQKAQEKTLTEQLTPLLRLEPSAAAAALQKEKEQEDNKEPAGGD